jgi:hypothetical protein
VAAYTTCLISCLNRIMSPQWAQPSFTRGFPGSAFLSQPDGTLLCPAGNVLTGLISTGRDETHTLPLLQRARGPQVHTLPAQNRLLECRLPSIHCCSQPPEKGQQESCQEAEQRKRKSHDEDRIELKLIGADEMRRIVGLVPDRHLIAV